MLFHSIEVVQQLILFPSAVHLVCIVVYYIYLFFFYLFSIYLSLSLLVPLYSTLLITMPIIARTLLLLRNHEHRQRVCEK